MIGHITAAEQAATIAALRAAMVEAEKSPGAPIEGVDWLSSCSLEGGKLKRKFNTHPADSTMRIGGVVVNKINARYDYRCAECLGVLEYWNNGLKCRADHAHRNFVHKRDVDQIQTLRDAEIGLIEASYEIIDGQLRPKQEVL